MKLLTTARAAEYLGISPATLRNMRHQGVGPKWVKMSPKGSYRYSVKALDEYIKERENYEDDHHVFSAS